MKRNANASFHWIEPTSSGYIAYMNSYSVDLRYYLTGDCVPEYGSDPPSLNSSVNSILAIVCCTTGLFSDSCHALTLIKWIKERGLLFPGQTKKASSE
jgi:hypothetical protein